MQKIVIDTNVLVSALIQRGIPFYIIYELFIDNKIELCISDVLFEEYYKVLHRDKFVKFPEFLSKAKTLLADIETKSTKYLPNRKLDIISDKDDNKLLELSEKCYADFLITGNTNDFTITQYKKTKIVTPRDYWENYRPE